MDDRETERAPAADKRARAAVVRFRPDTYGTSKTPGPLIVPYVAGLGAARRAASVLAAALEHLISVGTHPISFPPLRSRRCYFAETIQHHEQEAQEQRSQQAGWRQGPRELPASRVCIRNWQDSGGCRRPPPFGRAAPYRRRWLLFLTYRDILSFRFPVASS